MWEGPTGELMLVEQISCRPDIRLLSA